MLLLVGLAHAGGTYDREGAEPAFWLATAIVVSIVAGLAWLWFSSRKGGPS